MLLRIIAVILLFCSLGTTQPTEPTPQDATKAILAAFDKYEVVGMHSAHGSQDVDDYILSLIRDPAFPGKVNDIVVECGNSLYQGILDRYIAGEDVPLREMQQVWRNTTQLMCSLSGFYEQLFPLVRQVNQKLPVQKRIRVLAADPAFDWSKVKNGSDIPRDRDSSIVSVMTKEVLAKQRKALMLFGLMHLLHGLPMNPSRTEMPMRATAVTLYEQTYPGLTFVVIPHRGFGTFSNLAAENGELEARMRSWPKPSLIAVNGTWFAALSMAYFFPVPETWRDRPLSGFVDGYLYVGPRDSLSHEGTPSSILDDKQYVDELRRRAALGGSTFSRFDPDAIRKADANPRFYPSH
jgi:hypothetical protein